MSYEPVSAPEANRLLARRHYLGPIGRGFCFGQREDGRLVAVMVWTNPTSRRLPQRRWLELARWCLTPEAGQNAGSQMHKAFVRWLRRHRAEITTLVSYSDPGQGHTGALYRACNWEWRPTWHRLRPPPSGNGAWTGGAVQGVKDRWVYAVSADPEREELLSVKDASIDLSAIPAKLWNVPVVLVVPFVSEALRDEAAFHEFQQRLAEDMG